MKESTRDVLLGLANKRDVASLVHVFENLSHESVDDDFVDVLCASLVSVEKLVKKTKIEDQTAIKDALRSPCELLGAERFLPMVLESKPGASYLDIVLQILEPSAVASIAVEEGVNDVLAELAARQNLGETASLWLFEVGLACDPAKPAFLCNLLRIWGQSSESDSSERTEEAMHQLASDESNVQMLRDQVLQAGPYDVPAVVGLFRVLGITGNAQHVSVIGPYIEDAGAWTKVSRVVFSAERIEGLLCSIEESGVATVAKDAATGDVLRDAKGFSQRLAFDPRFHTGMAKILGSRATLFAIGRLFIESQFIAAVKSIVSDQDAPVRLAAVNALKEIGSPDTVPYLLSGTIDRNKDVRKAAATACRVIIGDEEYQKHLDSLKEEADFFRRRLHGLQDWARETLGSIEKSLGEAVEVAKSTPSRLGAATRKFLRRKED